MILDNLYSINNMPNIHIYNNMNLPILNTFEHDGFNISILDNTGKIGMYNLGIKNT